MKNEICLPCKQKSTMYENILNSATKYPNRNALIYFFKNIKYKTLLKRINSFAYHLKDIGVKKDDIVFILGDIAFGGSQFVYQIFLMLFIFYMRSIKLGQLQILFTHCLPHHKWMKICC